jgi:transcriptional regulator with XRE-family HTH domain
MGRRPNQLTPTASLAHYFGAEVRRLRQASGLSQQGLAQLVLHSPDLVRKIEAASRMPSQQFVERCDEVLDAHGGLVRLWPMLERERLLQSAPFGAIGYSSEVADRPVLDWLIDSSAFRAEPALQGRAESERLRELRQVDREQGAGSTYPKLSAILGHGLVDLTEDAPALAAGFLELAGYDAVDLGADGLAQHHYLHALRIATAAGDRRRGGYLVGVSLGHLALHVGDARQALRLANAAAREFGGVATPALRATIGAVAARAHARLRDEAACLEALGQVEAELSRSDLSGEPEWIAYFGEPDLADEKAHCFFDLRRDRLAQQEASTAVRSMARSRVRRLAMDTALYASALARSGEVEAACAAGRDAIDFAARTASFRSAHRVALMMAELQGFDTAPARELTDYAATAMPPVPAFRAACS